MLGYPIIPIEIVNYCHSNSGTALTMNAKQVFCIWVSHPLCSSKPCTSSRKLSLPALAATLEIKLK